MTIWIAMAIWFAIILGVAISLAYLITKGQKENIRKSTYLETINVDGITKTVQKPKCPVCGNKILDYQIVNTVVGAHKVTNNVNTIHSVNVKHAICNKCSNSFKVVTRTTPISNFIISFLLSVLICSVGLIIISILMIVI